MSRKLILALENEQAIAEAVAEAAPDAEVAIPDAAESPETAMLEVQEQSVEGDAQGEEVSAAVDVTEALGEYEEVLGTIETSGGISAESLQILNIGLKYAYRRVGLPSESMALESLTTRKDTTKAVMESIGSAIGNVVKAIIDAIKRGIQWLVNFFKSFFSATAKMQERAKKLKELADKATGSFEIGDSAELFGKLSMDGKVDMHKAVQVISNAAEHNMLDPFKKITESSSYLAFVSTEGASTSDISKELGKVAENIIGLAKSDVSIVLPGEKVLSLDVEGLKQILDNPKSSSVIDQALEGGNNKYLGSVQEALQLIQNTYRFKPKDGATPGSGKLMSLSSSDITTVLTGVEHLLEKARAFEKESKSLENSCQKVINNSTKILANPGFDLQAKLRQNLLKIASLNLTVGNTVCNQAFKTILEFSKNSMDYCEKSIKLSAA